MLTKGQRRALGFLLSRKEREIVCDGGYCMIDQLSISRRTVYALLGVMAIKDAGYAGAGCDIYIPTPNAIHIWKRPALGDEMRMRVFQSKPFFVDDQGTIRDA